MISAAAVLAGASLLYVGVRRLLRLALVLDFRRLGGRARISRPPLSSRSRTARVATVAAALAVLTAAVAHLTHGEPALAHPITGCNGYAQLCDRQLSDVVFPATHNSMASATDSGWLFPSQDRGIADQLKAGVRGLLIDTHYGVRSSRGVATELTAQTRKLATAVDAVGPGFIASVNRLRAAIGFNHTGRRTVYLCHAFCEVGATAAVQALRQIRDFLIARPNQVVILSVEDDVAPNATEAAFRESGLLDLVYRGPSGPWPTLRQLIEQDRRVVVFAENRTGGIPWYRPQFQLMQETPYHFTSTKQLAQPSSCRANRGGSGKALFLLNNWVDTSPGPETRECVDRERIRASADSRAPLPNHPPPHPQSGRRGFLSARGPDARRGQPERSLTLPPGPRLACGPCRASACCARARCMLRSRRCWRGQATAWRCGLASS